MKILFEKMFTINLVLVLMLSFLGLSAFAANSNSLTIGFGSCADQNREQAIWNTIAKTAPDLFILMGDNAYIDSEKQADFNKAYNKLSSNRYFAKFRGSTPILATWDDHDYGLSDGGKYFKGKKISKAAFIDFFDYPELRQLEQSNRGIYHSRWLKFNQEKIQIIMLDTRWYRDSLIKTYLSDQQRLALNLGPYQPTMDKSTTVLGDEQWLWLENELQKPADLKILVSSIQFLAEFTGWETWANFPHERQRLLDLLSKFSNNDLLILSGDIHKAEISQLSLKNSKLLEITSSPLAARAYPASNNRHKIGETFVETNYGLIEIEDNEKLIVTASIFNSIGEKKLTVSLEE